MLQSRARVSVASRPRALSSPGLLQPSASLQNRTFCFRRRPNDWASHIDPLYHRFTRYRTLKTRAKLLATIKRRSRFNWDADHRPFFTPKQLRFASHWGCNPRGGRWMRFHENGEESQQKSSARPEATEAGKANEDEVELSSREKLWKEQVGAFKKRLDSDPYEAVFGKRFEPFWSPLVPSWMRDDMGLRGWEHARKGDDDISRTVDATPSNSTEKLVPSTQDSTTKSSSGPGVAPVKVDAEAEAKKGESLKTYSSYSSTSWDSWTQKTRRTTWDSLSGQTKRFEYDPISNRMVQVEGQGMPTNQIAQSTGASTIETPKDTALQAAKSQAVDIPVKKSTEIRQSIPVPTDLAPIARPLDMASLINEPARSMRPNPESSTTPARSTRPSQLAKMPKDDLDLLTADAVRAAMGKAKSTVKQMTLEERQQLEKSFDEAARREDVESKALLQQRRSKAVMSGGSPAWSVAFDESASPSNVHKEAERYYQSSRLQSSLDRLTEADAGKSSSGRLETSLDRMSKASSEELSPSRLQPAAERMQRKSLPIREVSSVSTNIPPSSVPKGWQDQASLLQADRIRRTTSKRPYPMKRWIDDMEAKRAEFECKTEALKEEQSTEKILQQQRKIKFQEILDAEVSNQKFMMQAHEGKWGHHLASALRQNPPEGVSGTRTTPSKAKDANASDPVAQAAKERQLMKEMQGEGDFCVNVTNFAKSDKKWYKQPTNGVQAEQLEKASQKAGDQALVTDVRRIYEGAYGPIDVKHRQPIVAREQKVIHDEPALNDALSRQEKDGHYDWKDDNLEAELARQEGQVHGLQASLPVKSSKAPRSSTSGSKLVNDEAPKLIPTALSEVPTSVSTPSASVSSGIQWQKPPVYKLLAYDSGNDRFSTATTTSNFTNSENPISIATALSQLYQPARFVPHFSQLQEEGYQVIYGTKDLLVFKKVAREAPPQKTSVKGVKQPVKTAPTTRDLSSPGLEAVKQHAATTSSVSCESKQDINPIDGTSKQYQAIGTGNSASPTGFVNHDSLFMPKDGEESQNNASSSAARDQKLGNLADPFTTSSSQHKVRREESVFTGTRRISSSNSNERSPYYARQREEYEIEDQEASGSYTRTDPQGRLYSRHNQAEAALDEPFYPRDSVDQARVHYRQKHHRTQSKPSSDSTTSTKEEAAKSSDWQRVFWKRAFLSGAGLVGASYLVGAAAEAGRESEERSKRVLPQADERWRKAIEERK
ncbi:hypothetical protein K431DRAFT_280713 [Polychaeton citri CBS 116435]|uniref:Uncharacterized protein n=1 Tax=Polychaeton citri CBS 116435 TaxID=1314669 RepID=A0A9P4QJD7_9PEZI|nr:hypothetical protein K431DRAFT_280713 [Polychaeton citri CBS 116435]